MITTKYFWNISGKQIMDIKDIHLAGFKRVEYNFIKNTINIYI